MISTNSSSASLITPSLPTPSSSNNPPPSDDSSSFGEVMQQHGGDSSSSAPPSNSNSSASNNPDQSNSNSSQDSSSTTTDTATPQPPMHAAGGGGKISHAKKSDPDKSATTTTSDTGLKSMLVRASVIASNAKVAVAAKDNQATDTTTATTDGTDLAALIAQALALTTKTDPKATDTKATTEKTSDDETAKDAPTTSTTPDIATLIAQASILALNGAADGKISTTTGKDVAPSTSTKGISATIGKEKKSSTTTSEGSFLQSSKSATSSTSDLLSTLGLTATNAVQSTSDQTVTMDNGSKKSAVDLLAKVSANTAGTASVDKEKNMNADPNIPTILSGSASTTGLQTPSDMQIKLSSNHNFDQALKTVLHVASLNEISQTRTATRVAIELQTPPGAIVNVYVTKQNDQWRAQLSTSDPQALSWVQDKMSSLRQTSDTGTAVHWLPPQIEAAISTSSTSSGNDTNLGWDRGGQNQSEYQQDDNRPSRRQGQGDESDLATAGANFMQNLIGSGRSS